MSAEPVHLYRRGRFAARDLPESTTLNPVQSREIRDALKTGSGWLPPFRPLGAGSAATDCSFAGVGTVVDMTGMDQLKRIDLKNMTVTVEAGMRIANLALELAESGLELCGGHELGNRTVGGAVAGASVGSTFGADGAFFASQVVSIRVVTPTGKRVEVRQDQRNLLNAYRLSMGMLGVIFEVTLKVRPESPFAVNYRRCNIDQFAGIAEILCPVDVALKFYILPFRDRVYVDVRRTSQSAPEPKRLGWRFKGWSERSVLPRVLRSLKRYVPLAGVRNRLGDEISDVTHNLVNNRMVTTGSNSITQICGAGDDISDDDLHYSTWFFPAPEFPLVLQAYRDFCLRTHAESGYRCDMPTVGFRVGRDRSSILSPSFDEPMIALRAVSTEARGWDEFVIDFGEFARLWGGVPAFNLTRDIPADYPRQVFGSRLSFFRRIRRQLDPNNRMLNSYLSQYFV